MALTVNHCHCMQLPVSTGERPRLVNMTVRLATRFSNSRRMPEVECVPRVYR